MPLIDDQHLVADRAALRAIVAEPGPRVQAKVIDRVDEICARFIAASPFVVLGTYGQDGLVDLSPKGDPAGFVQVLDEKTLLLPDRLGNGRLDSFENLLGNPSVSLIFLIPGHNDTLRVGGRGRLTTQPDLLARSAIKGRLPDLAVLITVEEAYLHCAKSMVRSRMWHADHWPDTSNVPSLADAMIAHGKLIESGLVADTGEMQAIIDDDRENRLY
ncbi:MAG: MSMEG_1061 family FMN-dependent PPOX-type flavoprotein [Pseudomonadota bacterium]